MYCIFHILFFSAKLYLNWLLYKSNEKYVCFQIVKFLNYFSLFHLWKRHLDNICRELCVQVSTWFTKERLWSHLWIRGNGYQSHCSITGWILNPRLFKFGFKVNIFLHSFKLSVIFVQTLSILSFNRRSFILELLVRSWVFSWIGDMEVWTFLTALNCRHPTV